MVINNLVETHCHILPGIDDGAKDVETSVKMVRRLQEQGCKAIILTPHYYSNEISLNDFIARRDNALNELKSALGSDSPKLIPAAEVYVTKYLLNYENLDKLKIGNTNYALLEHSFSEKFDDECFDRLNNLNYDYGITPILAHIERYPYLLNKPEILESYLDAGCLAQVNISTFSEAPRGVKKKLFKHLENGRIHLIGSDAHGINHRPPEYEDGINEIIKHSSREAVETLEKNAQILAGIR